MAVSGMVQLLLFAKKEREDMKNYNDEKEVERTKYVCTKTISHPNMGILIRKGEVVYLTKVEDNLITIGGINLYPSYLLTHFQNIE